MRLATESAGLATWDIDTPTASARSSSHMFRMLGLPAGHGPASLTMWT